MQAPHQSPQPQHFDNRRLYEPERYPHIQDAHHRSLLSVAYQQHAPLGCQPAERESIIERDFGELELPPPPQGQRHWQRPGQTFSPPLPIEETRFDDKVLSTRPDAWHMYDIAMGCWML